MSPGYGASPPCAGGTGHPARHSALQHMSHSEATRCWIGGTHQELYCKEDTENRRESRMDDPRDKEGPKVHSLVGLGFGV